MTAREHTLLAEWVERRKDQIPPAQTHQHTNWAFEWATEATAQLGFRVTWSAIYRKTREYRYAG